MSEHGQELAANAMDSFLMGLTEEEIEWATGCWIEYLKKKGYKVLTADEAEKVQMPLRMLAWRQDTHYEDREAAERLAAEALALLSAGKEPA